MEYILQIIGLTTLVIFITKLLFELLMSYFTSYYGYEITFINFIKSAVIAAVSIFFVAFGVNQIIFPSIDINWSILIVTNMGTFFVVVGSSVIACKSLFRDVIRSFIKEPEKSKNMWAKGYHRNFYDREKLEKNWKNV